MTKFVRNATDFSADCALKNGQCRIARENFLFLKNGDETAAVRELQMKCGHVVIVGDKSRKGKALLYHTSCQRMTDVVSQLFADALGAPASVQGSAGEMTVGDLYRRSVAVSFDTCRAKVKRFAF
jgi:hypothetical protein